jgi:dTDP-glucose 4,6-dehydratase
MKTYLVTGAAGFIGANYIKYILAKHSDIKVVVLDALTYAGNLGTIAKDIDNERCFFIKGDICSREVVDSLFAEYRFDYVVNFAAERKPATVSDHQHPRYAESAGLCPPCLGDG